MTTLSQFSRLLALLCLVFGIAGCSWMPFIGGDDELEPLPEEVDTNEQKLYSNAQRYLRTGNYQQAIAALERLEARFPFGRYAEQAQLELIYACYMSFDHDSAVAAADRFLASLTDEEREEVFNDISRWLKRLPANP